MKNRIPVPIPHENPQPKAHKVCCAHCPSAPHRPQDPEVQDILKWPKAARIETAFACGWNGKRYCKGYCDTMGITEQDLIAHDKAVR